MRVEGDLIWWSPVRRAVIPVESFSVSRSLRRAARGYEIRVDTAFADVVSGCADPQRPHGWIDASFVTAYDSRPMSFVSPITNRSSTSPMPTIETRS